MTVQQVTQATAAASGAPQFRNTLNNQPLNMSLYPNETLTTEAIQFRRTGRNPYKGDTSAAASGRALYDQWCASCHLADGAGRIGPNLTDTTVVHPRVATDVGLFEIIYGGGSGAMQSFGNRLTQDEILRVMAFVETLKKR
jgi:cytochrome c-L